MEGGKGPFASHPIKGTRYQRDLELLTLTLMAG